jgi:hypothetical protein
LQRSDRLFASFLDCASKLALADADGVKADA